MSRITQIKKHKTADELQAHFLAADVDLPVGSERPIPEILGAPIDVSGPTTKQILNRFAVLPMEGWDGTTDGRPTDLVRRRWQRFAQSGAGLIWGEATAVQPDGRANPNQLIIDASTVDELAALRSLLDPSQVSVLQLTHSGRYARPTSEGPQPRTLYEHPLLDARVGATAANIYSDDEVDELVATFVNRAVLGAQAGFDFVDVKACHGYLGHEFLSAHDRPGRYGGDLEGRTRFVRSVIEGIRHAAPALGIAVRISLFDFVPHSPGPDGRGEPDASLYRHAFGGDGTGVGVDLTETHALIDRLVDAGVTLLSATAGSPYYVPHIQRPAYFPPSDGYQPPEDPLVGVARLAHAIAAITTKHPEVTTVGGGLSYLQQWLPAVGAGLVEGGSMDLVGLGRMILSYPTMAADVLAGQPLQDRLICRTFSDCTTAPRHGMVSGCYPLDDFYFDREERIELAGIKKRSRAALRAAQ